MLSVNEGAERESSTCGLRDFYLSSISHVKSELFSLTFPGWEVIMAEKRGINVFSALGSTTFA